MGQQGEGVFKLADVGFEVMEYRRMLRFWMQLIMPLELLSGFSFDAGGCQF